MESESNLQINIDTPLRPCTSDEQMIKFLIIGIRSRIIIQSYEILCCDVSSDILRSFDALHLLSLPV